MSATRPTRLTFRGDGGCQLVADAYGNPSASKKALFLHGGGQTRHSWGGTASELAKLGWYTVSADLRGHGESEWSKTKDYSMVREEDKLRRKVQAKPSANLQSVLHLRYPHRTHSKKMS